MLVYNKQGKLSYPRHEGTMGEQRYSSTHS